MPRHRIGYRQHVAQFQRHNGNRDEHGTPTYGLNADWETLVEAWPCELLSTTAGETLRGRQVTARTTHVLFGEYFGAGDVRASDRAVVGGTEYGIVAAYDPEGTYREMRVELRLEV